MPLFLNPTTDIHLFVGGQPMELRMLGEDDAGLPWSDIAAHPNLVGTVGALRQGPNVVQVIQTATGVRFQPVAPPVQGTGFYQVITSLNLPMPVGIVQLNGLVRVSVHPGIQRFWAGNNRVTLFEGESNYVLTVYGQFAAGIADITGHPYIQYVPADPAIATVSAGGRVTGVSQGQTTIAIQIPGIAAIPPVPVRILARVADHRPLTFRIKPGSQENPVFVLAEGYTDGASFRRHAREVADRWFRCATQSPFDLLADSFDVWGVFDPTQENRITLAPPVWTAQLGDVFRVPPGVPADLRLVQARDSRFGLMYGDRLGSPRAVPHTAARPARTSWLTTIATPRSVGVDYRRVAANPIDPRVASRGFLSRYLEAAQLPGATKNNVRTLFLVEDELRGGALLDVTGRGFAPSNSVAAVLQSGARFSHVAAPGGHPRVDKDPAAPAPRFEREVVTAIATHEFGHSFDLGDEYENSTRIGGRNQLPLNQPDLAHHAEDFENLHAQGTLNAPAQPGGINVDLIKWNHLRVKKISFVKSLVRRPSDEIAVEVSRKERRKWKRGDRANLGTTARSNVSTRLTVAGLEADAVLLEPDGNLNLALYPFGSFLFAPKQKGEDDRRLIDPAVLEHIRLNGPFPRSNPNCAQFTEGKHVPTKNIAGFSQPDNRWRVLGLYDGGGGFNCGVQRPAGLCRMRDSFDEARDEHIGFCFVCRYIIVDRVDPLKHDTLDKCYYPEDC